jgi:hypothetical protein
MAAKIHKESHSEQKNWPAIYINRYSDVQKDFFGHAKVNNSSEGHGGWDLL